MRRFWVKDGGQGRTAAEEATLMKAMAWTQLLTAKQVPDCGRLWLWRWLLLLQQQQQQQHELVWLRGTSSD